MQLKTKVDIEYRQDTNDKLGEESPYLWCARLTYVDGSTCELGGLTLGELVEVLVALYLDRPIPYQHPPVSVKVTGDIFAKPVIVPVYETHATKVIPKMHSFDEGVGL